MDTDSFALSMAGEIDDLVVLEKRDRYEMEKNTWFLVDNSSYEKRYPGKLKTEFKTNNGVFIGLSPKVLNYFLNVALIYILVLFDRFKFARRNR